VLSPNIDIRKAYFAALSTIKYNNVLVPVYWGQLPTSIAPGIYIVFSQIRNNNASLKSSSITETSVTVSVYTNSLKYNDGLSVESVANEVLNRIYPIPTFNLTLADSFFQILKTTLQSDITNDFSQFNQIVYIDRILTFSHTIFQNVS
jgi:hypothetical protein